MATNTKYRSIFTGQEIDEAIASLKAAGNNQAIILANDFSGGATKAASADLAKNLNDRVAVFENTTSLYNIIAGLPNFRVYTDSEHNQLVAVSSVIKGSFLNPASRTASSIDATNFSGTEVTFLMDDGSGDGLSEVSRWDTVSKTWRKMKFQYDGNFSNTQVQFAGATTMFSFDKTKYNTMKCIVSAVDFSQTQRHIQEVLLTFIGSDTYISVYGEVGNATLFALTSSMVNNNVNLIVTTNTNNVTISGKVLARI